MITANDTADKDVKPKKGVYLMTDIYGNQRKVKVTPAEKSMKIELLEPAPKLKTDEILNNFLYKKGSTRLLFGPISPLYCWNSMEYKVYPKSGSEPLYFEFQSKIQYNSYKIIKKPIGGGIRGE